MPLSGSSSSSSESSARRWRFGIAALGPAVRWAWGEDALELRPRPLRPLLDSFVGAARFLRSAMVPRYAS